MVTVGRPSSSTYSSSFSKSSICAIVWSAKELLMTKDGCPVALPRFIRRPSDRTMIEVPSAKVHSWTCGLISVLVMPSIRARPAMSISLSK